MPSGGYLASHLLNAGFFAISSGLTITSVFLLSQKVAVHQSRLLWTVLLGYVALMGVLSLTAIISDSLKFIASVQHHTNRYRTGFAQDPDYDTLRPILPLALWCAEGFMASVKSC